MHDGNFGAMPQWYPAMKGAEKLRVSLASWLGLPEWQQVPECVKSWTHAMMVCDAYAQQGRSQLAQQAKRGAT